MNFWQKFSIHHLYYLFCYFSPLCFNPTIPYKTTCNWTLILSQKGLIVQKKSLGTKWKIFKNCTIVIHSKMWEGKQYFYEQ